MDTYRLGAVESRFADLIWQHKPLSIHIIFFITVSNVSNLSLVKSVCGLKTNRDGELGTMEIA